MAVRGIDELAAAVAVARLRNFRAAAVELGVSRSALSHAVAALEERIGVRLFHRTTRSVAPTEAGARFVAAIAPALGEIRDAIETAGAHRGTPAGTLRLNTSVSAARQVLPLLIEFARRFPAMSVDLVTEGRLVDIVRDGFDAGIRIAETVPQDMIAIPIGPEQRPMVVGSPDYLSRCGVPTNPHELRGHRCIRSRMPSGKIWRWEFERKGEALAIDVEGPMTFDETSLMVGASVAGLGLAYLTQSEVEEHLASGQLVQVLADWTPPYPGLCLYYPGRRHLPSGLRALVDLIQERRRSG